MGNLEVLGIQELALGDQRALVGGGPLATKIGLVIGFIGGVFAGLDDFVWEFAEGFAEGFAEEYGSG